MRNNKIGLYDIYNSHFACRRGGRRKSLARFFAKFAEGPSTYDLQRLADYKYRGSERIKRAEQQC